MGESSEKLSVKASKTALQCWCGRWFQFARGSRGDLDFCGSGWLSRHFQCLATFFDPYRGRGRVEFGDDDLQRGVAVGDFG